MKLIRLSKRQVETTRLSNPIFDLQIVKTDEQNTELLARYLKTPTDLLREEILLTNLHLIRHTVGRYLVHWTETKRWEEDMVSVGLCSLLNSLDKLTHKQVSYFRPWAVLRLKHDIETFLNTARCAVSASLTTNYRRLKRGEQLASKQDAALGDHSPVIDNTPNIDLGPQKLLTKKDLLKLFRTDKLPDDFPKPINQQYYKTDVVEDWLINKYKSI